MKILVIGKIWQGIKAAYCYTPGSSLVLQPSITGKISHTRISNWLKKYAGEFQEISDFKVVDAEGKTKLDWFYPKNDDVYFDMTEG